MIQQHPWLRPLHARIMPIVNDPTARTPFTQGRAAASITFIVVVMVIIMAVVVMAIILLVLKAVALTPRTFQPMSKSF
jgi:hypothetical protein